MDATSNDGLALEDGDCTDPEDGNEADSLAQTSLSALELWHLGLRLGMHHTSERVTPGGAAPASPAGPSPVHVLFGPRTGRGSPAAGPAAVCGNPRCTGSMRYN